MMWQPIETAPKTGSSILLATPKGRIADGFWSPVYGVWSWPYVMVEPTHWMPLPERPSTQAQPAPSFADAYQGAMEEVAIWKKRALEAEDLNRKFVAEINGPTYMGEPAQPAPSEQDASARKAWARFSHELHRSPDAPYPGMSDAFEQHFSQSFTDREWRAEASTWAAAWKAAKRHGAQPAPSAPREAIDKMLTQLMDIAVSNGANSISMPDEYVEVAAWLCGIPAQPATSVPEGWQLVPTAESRHPGIYRMLGALHATDNTPGMSEWESYRAMLSEAPEATP